MKFCLISRDERHAFLLERLEREEHEVLLLCQHDTGAWRNLVPRARNLQEVVQFQPDMTLIDSPGYGHVAKVLQETGLKVFGGSKLQDQLAQDHLYGMTLLENCGVKTSECNAFNDIPNAQEFIQVTKEQPWLMRYSDGRYHSAGSNEEMQLHLETLASKPPKFALQRGFPTFVNSTLMVRPSYLLVGIYNAQGLMNPGFKMELAYNLLPDGQGIPTIEGATLRPLTPKDSLFQDVLRKLETSLKALSYTGLVFLGCTEERSVTRTTEEPAPASCCVVDFQVSPPDGFWAALVGGLTRGMGTFLERALNPSRGHLTPFDFYDGYVCSRKLTLPPYPFTESPWVGAADRLALSRIGIPHTTFPREDWGVAWNDVYLREDGLLQACGPVVGYATGKGKTYSEASREISRVAAGLPIPYIQVKADDATAEFNLG